MKTFLCGCSTEPRPNYGENAVKHDSDGERICPEHGARLSGYLSRSYQSIGGHRIFVATEERKRAEKANWKPDTSTPDRRDNRDPEKVGLEYLQREAAFNT